MAKGPNEARFLTALEGAEPGDVDEGAREWERCAGLLTTVAKALERAAKRDQEIGGETGPALGAAFKRTAATMMERSKELTKGEMALRDAAKALRQAKQGKEQVDREHPPVDHPGSYQKPVGPLKPEDLEEQAAHQRAITKYNETYAAREKAAEYWTKHIDETFNKSAAVMQEIHGEVPEKGDPGGPNHKGDPQGRDDGRTDDDRTDDPTDDRDNDPDDRDPDDHDRDPDDGGSDDDGGNDDHEDDDSSGGGGSDDDHGSGGGGSGDDDSGGGIGRGTIGGVAAGGVAGALALGGLRGGFPLPTSVSSTGARPIGTSGRVGTSGALGRGTGVVPGSQTGRGTGARGAGTGARTGGMATRGNGRTGAGSRGGRGGKAGTGAAGSGRGGRKKDEEKKQTRRDLFDDGQDWIDDEGAAPDVLK